MFNLLFLGHTKDKTGSLYVFCDGNGVWRGKVNYDCQKGAGLNFTVSILDGNI